MIQWSIQISRILMWTLNLALHQKWIPSILQLLSMWHLCQDFIVNIILHQPQLLMGPKEVVIPSLLMKVKIKRKNRLKLLFHRHKSQNYSTMILSLLGSHIYFMATLIRVKVFKIIKSHQISSVSIILRRNFMLNRTLKFPR
jgi:hypothetical protein